MASQDHYRVISSLPVVVEDGGQAVSFQPGQVFTAKTTLDSILRLLRLGYIVRVASIDAGNVPLAPTVVSNDSGWTDDGPIVRLTALTDTVTIGAATMFSAEKLRVVGDVRIEGKLTVTGLIDPTGLYLDEIGADQPAVANKGVFYTKDVIGVTQAFYRASDGTITQMTPIGPSGGNLDTSYHFGAPGTGRTVTVDEGAVAFNKAIVDATNAFEVNVTGGTGLSALFSGAPVSCPGAGANSERFGAGAIAGGLNSTVLGNNSTDGSFQGVTIVGRASSTTNDFGTIFGNASTSGFNSVVIGPSSAAGDNSVSVGANIVNPGNNNVAIGQGVSFTGLGDSVAIGQGSSVDQEAVAIGANATASFANNIAIGNQALADADRGNIAIGAFAFASVGSGNVAIGDAAYSSSLYGGPGGIAIGLQAFNQYDSICMGFQTYTDANHQFTAGRSHNPCNDVTFGAGVRTPLDVTWDGRSADYALLGTSGLANALIADPVVAPTGSVVAGVTGTFTPGAYQVKYAIHALSIHTDDVGETLPSPASLAFTITTLGERIVLNPIPDPLVSGYVRVYVETAPGSGIFQYSVDSPFAVPINVLNPGAGDPPLGVNTTFVDGHGHNIMICGGEADADGIVGGDVLFGVNLPLLEHVRTTVGRVSATDGSLSWPGAGTNSQRFGPNTTAGIDTIVLGDGVNVASSGVVAIGRSITMAVGTDNSVAIGNGVTFISNGGSVAIGQGSTVGPNSVAVGANTTATNSSIAIGTGANVPGDVGIGIGGGISNAFSSICLGQDSYSTGNFQLTAGRATGGGGRYISDIYFGGGVRSPTDLSDYTIHGTSGYFAAALPDPGSAPTGSVVADAATLTPGNYQVQYTYVATTTEGDPLGETLPSPLSVAFTITTLGEKIVLDPIASPGGTAVLANIYVESAPASGIFLFLGSANFAVAIDILAPGTGVAPPVVNTTANDGHGHILALAGGDSDDVALPGGDIDFYTNRTGAAHTLTLAGRFSAIDGGFRSRVSVIPYTANFTLTSSEEGQVSTNTGAGGAIALDLPSGATVGDIFDYAVTVAQYLRINATGATTITLGAIAGVPQTTASNGFVRSNVIGSMLKIMRVSTTQWFARVTGDWTVGV